MKKQLNPTLTYVLSIFSLLCCCFGGLGVLLAGPAFYMANKKIKDAQLNPEEYEGDINTMNTAKIVALVALVINAVTILWTIYDIYTNGFGNWDQIMEEFNKGFEEARQQQGQ